MDGLRHLRFALRKLAGNPGFAGVAVVTLALGAHTAIFTLMDQVLLCLLPVKAPARLVVLDGWGPFSGSTHSHSASLAELSHPLFLEMRDKPEVFAGVLRQHQPLYRPLAGAREGGESAGPSGRRDRATAGGDAAADRGVPQRATPSWRTAFQWRL